MPNAFKTQPSPIRYSWGEWELNNLREKQPITNTLARDRMHWKPSKLKKKQWVSSFIFMKREKKKHFLKMRTIVYLASPFPLNLINMSFMHASVLKPYMLKWTDNVIALRWKKSKSKFFSQVVKNIYTSEIAHIKRFY